MENIFEPVQRELDRQEEAYFRAVLAEAVSPHTKTEWPMVDQEMAQLGRYVEDSLGGKG